MRAMKDSGIPWIGEIPDGWTNVYLKHYFDFEKGKNAALYTQEYIGENEGIFPVYSGQTENEGVMGRINTYDYDEPECLFTTTVGAKVMTPRVLQGKFSLSQNCLIMKSIKTTSVHFFYYGLSALFDYEKSLIPSHMQPSLRIEDLKKYKLFIPPLAEQQRIAKFLDRKCSEVDEMIALQEQIIEELKAYKQSVITEAVTKGLNPAAPMRDSGIEWIGSIPEHWEVKRLKNLATDKDSLIIDGDWIESDVIESDGIRYLTTGNIGDGVFKEQGQGYISEDTFKVLNCTMVYAGDLVFSRLNYPMGRSCIIPDKYTTCVVAVDNVVFRPNKDVVKKYLMYVSMCYGFQNENALIARGATMQRMSRSQLVKAFVPTPTPTEQQAIADYLDEKCADIDSLIQTKQSKIDSLKEYKKSIIYEYVTGKREVE